MIIGVGIDIVEIERIEKALEKRDAFLNKIFNKSEIEYLSQKNFRPEFVSGKFAAKEAISKALGTGFRGFEFKDIIVENNALGKPLGILKGKAKIIAQKNGNYRLHISISHGCKSAVAYAVLEVVEDESGQC